LVVIGGMASLVPGEDAPCLKSTVMARIEAEPKDILVVDHNLLVIYKAAGGDHEKFLRMYAAQVEQDNRHGKLPTGYSYVQEPLTLLVNDANYIGYTRCDQYGPRRSILGILTSFLTTRAPEKEMDAR